MRENKEYGYLIPKKEVQPAGQLYLGTFLAFALFFSFFFGNLLFFLIVFVISVLIFLEKDVDISDKEGNLAVRFSKDLFVYGLKEYLYKEVESFTMHEELFGEKLTHLRIVFKSPGKQDLFIPIENSVQKEKIYDIIKKNVKEDRARELSLVDSLVLRFF